MSHNRRIKATRSDRPISKRKAVERALRRLGLHARPPAVVELLAGEGIEVSQNLVRRVKIDMLKGTTEARRQLAKAARKGSVPRHHQKRPPRRGNRV